MIARQVLTISLSLYCAVILQAAIASHITIGVARPDFVTVTIVSLGLLTGFGRGVVSGLWGGFLFATLCGANYGSYMVSRAFAGGLMGLVPKDIHRENIYIPISAVLVTTIATEVIYFIMAPVSPVGWWAKVIIEEALYNCVVVLPVFWTIQRLLPKPAVRPAFATQRR